MRDLNQYPITAEEVLETDSWCDCCEKPWPWEDLATGDDGETWICPACVPQTGT